MFMMPTLIKIWEEAIDTVVIPGCGSSPLGAAALGKAVAQILQRPVAAIVAGERDLLMALNASKTLISRILLEGKIHPDRPLDPREDPDERLFAGCQHNLIGGRPDHLPIEAILPAIREGRPLVRA
jgi:hypothetical protein